MDLVLNNGLQILNYQMNRIVDFSISEKFKLDVNLFKGVTMKKIFFIICISAVFFIGLLVFKTTSSNNTYSVTVKNRNVGEIITDGLNNLKSWGSKTFRSFGLYRDNIHHNLKDSTTKDIKKKLSMNNDNITSLKSFINDTAAFFFRGSAEKFNNHCVQADETAARVKLPFKLMNELTLKLF